jgi:hypothetical protein
MKTPVQRRPPRISGNVDVTSKEGLSRMLSQIREGLNFLLDANSTSSTGSVKKGGSNLAIFGQNVVDATGTQLETIGSDQIAAGAITEDHLSDDSISGDALQPGSVDGGHINAGAVDGIHVAAGTLTDDHVVDDQSLVASAGITVDVTTGALQIDLSKSASGIGGGIETVIFFDTEYANDGAQLSVQADMTQVTNVPATVAAANVLGMVTDAQTVLPLAGAIRQVLRNDGGAFYQDNQYSGGESDGLVLGGSNFMSSATQSMTTSYVTVGNVIQVKNPGTGLPLTVRARSVLVGKDNTGSTNIINSKLQISMDGGSTYTDSPVIGDAGNYLQSEDYPISEVAMTLTGIPTGDIFIRVQAKKNGSTDTMQVLQGGSFLEYDILNSSSGTAAAAPLVATLPSTASMSCTSSFPTSTCPCTKTLTPTVSGGLRPLSYANSVTGTGSILSGATASAFTITDTETTTTGGATHNTVGKSKITTAETYTVTAASWLASVATVTIGAGHAVVTGQTVRATTFNPTGYNGTLLSITGVTSTQIKYAVAVNPGAYVSGGTVDLVTTTTNNCTVTGTFTLTYPAVSVSVSAGNASPQCGAETGNSCTAKTTLTVHVTGGTGSYPTYSNTVFSGAASILSGATASSYVVAYGAVVTFGTTSVFQSNVTDSLSHTGAGRKSIFFNGIDIS